MTLEPDPIATAARGSARKRRLGPDAACALCGLSDPVQLTRQRRRLEEHHVATRCNDADLTAVLCLNCHATVSERQRTAGLFSAGEPANVLDRLTRALVSLATFSEALATALRRWADHLQDLMASLDRHLPTWRTLRAAA